MKVTKEVEPNSPPTFLLLPRELGNEAMLYVASILLCIG